MKCDECRQDSDHLIYDDGRSVCSLCVGKGAIRKLEKEIEYLKKENAYLNEQGKQVAEDYQDMGRKLYYESLAHNATKDSLGKLKSSNAELLALLESNPDIMDAMDGWKSCDDPECHICDWVLKARAAIAKTKGE